MTFIIATTLTADPRTGLAAAKTLDGHIDFALIPDGLTGLDALEFSSWLSPLTTELGLVPEVRVTHMEPFHSATASATLDYTARARAGLAIGVSTTPAEAALFGRRGSAAATSAWAEAAQIIDLIRRLWDSWDDDAIIRDRGSDRFIDRGRLHYVDAHLRDSVGTDYSVLGPSITPRPPQGHPPIVVRAGDAAAAAVEAADLVIAEAGEAAALRSHGSDGPVVLAEIEGPTTPSEVRALIATARELHAAGAEGILISAPPAAQIELSIRLVSEIVPALVTAGVRGVPTPDLDLRTRLGLPAATSLFSHA